MILDVKYPPLTSYVDLASYLSALTCNESGMLWYYNNYIQLYTVYGKSDNEFSSDSVNGKILFRDQLFGTYTTREFHYRYNPFLTDNTIEDYTLFFSSDEIVEKIKHMVDNNYYMIIFIDTYYINEIVNKRHVLHSVFLYGYDDENFYIGHFINGGKFCFCSISFQNLILSYKSNIQVPWWYDSKEKMIIFKIKDIKYDFDKNLFVRLFQDYYYAQNTLDAYEFKKNAIEINSKNENMIFGIEIYNFLIEYIRDIRDEKKELVISRVYLFLDHKKALFDKCNFLVQYGYVKKNNIILESKNIYTNMEVFLSLLIKYSICRKKELLDKGIKILHEEFHREKLLIENMLSEL